MARPKKNPKLVKDDYLKIPVTSEQKKVIVEAAQSVGDDMAPWARSILMRAAKEQAGQKKSQKR